MAISEHLLPGTFVFVVVDSGNRTRSILWLEDVKGGTLNQHLLALTVLFFIGCGARIQDSSSKFQEPIVGLPCEGCEGVFEGLPDSLQSSARIAPEGTPGQAMRIVGIVRDKQGEPVAGVIVYAYHTDAEGLYPPNDEFKNQAAYRHGVLRGWAKTDEKGRYRFDTIRPAGYPDTVIPAHVHMHVVEVGRCTYYIDDLLFEDDPRLTEQMRKELTLGRGGSGITSPVRDKGGNWTVTRDITLGEKIPGYPE